jgi:tryptophan-rich sensory protein
LRDSVAGSISNNRQGPMRLWQKIILSIVVAETLGGLGGILTASSIKDWYASLTEPPGTPPNWIFGPVWTILYGMIAVSFALIWHRSEKGRLRSKAFAIFAIQALLNLSWTPVFFGVHQLGLALAIIIFLAGSIVATIIAFRKIDRTASVLLIPYLIWVCYATYLNGGYWYCNR